MGSKKVQERSGALDEAEQASLAVRKAIGPLVKLLGHEDDLVVYRAVEALDRLGAGMIVGPLSDALPRAKGGRHRCLIVRLLQNCGSEEKFRVLPALNAAMRREKNLDVAAFIQKTVLVVTFSPEARGS